MRTVPSTAFRIFLSSRSSKKPNGKLYKIIILYVFYMGVKLFPHPKGTTLSVFWKIVLRKIF